MRRSPASVALPARIPTATACWRQSSADRCPPAGHRSESVPARSLRWKCLLCSASLQPDPCWRTASLSCCPFYWNRKTTPVHHPTPALLPSNSNPLPAFWSLRTNSRNCHPTYSDRRTAFSHLHWQNWRRLPATSRRHPAVPHRLPAFVRRVSACAYRMPAVPRHCPAYPRRMSRQ